MQDATDLEAAETAAGAGAFLDLAASPEGVLSGEEGDGEASHVSTVEQSLEIINDRMRDLATNRGDSSVKKRSKKDRAATKSVFRTLQAALEDGTCPETHVRLKHGDVLTVRTWVQTTQLSFLRRYLGTGFQAHLQYNPLLHEVFEFVPRVERGEDAGRGKRANPGVAKALALDRKFDREVSLTRKGSRAMLAEEDYS